MRRFLALLIPAALIVPVAPASAEIEVTGTIAVPTATVARAQRCVDTTIGASGQGIFGWRFDVTPGKRFDLAAQAARADDFDIAFYTDLGSCAGAPVGPNAVTPVDQHVSQTGDESGIVPSTARYAIVNLYAGTPGAAFRYRESDVAPLPAGGGVRSHTVIAVVDSSFTPYHYDFVGHQHPWNLDANPGNDIDFSVDPSTYIEGMPSPSPINVTIPTAPTETVSTYRTGKDVAEWNKFQYSTPSDAKINWFPGTKIIGALSFAPAPTMVGPVRIGSQNFYGDNSAHGTRSAASAGGNIHGTCPECLFVLVQDGGGNAGLEWAAKQPWIDIVTNSYGHNTVPSGVVRDNIYFGAPLEATKDASERGQTILFSSGNGFLNAFDVPMFTYWSSEKGPDWMITVGAIEPRGQTYSGAGKPVDISSIGTSYPSTGGTTATGTGTHSGTSNATPVVAGYFAKAIQRSRELLGDTVEGVSSGIVAQGTPVPCGGADPSCPLGDGTLTRAELQDVILKNVRPSKLGASADTAWPTTEHSYYYQGHGTVRGLMNGAGSYVLETRRFLDALTGAAPRLARSQAESNWFVVDSKCRQNLWGSWTGGYFKGATPELDRQSDPIAFSFNEWCSRTPDEAFKVLAEMMKDL